MAATLPNVTLEPNVWTDINDATGIAVGTAMLIQNLDGNTVQVCRKSTQPTQEDGFNKIYRDGNPLSWLTIEAGEPTIWLRCAARNVVNVQ